MTAGSSARVTWTMRQSAGFIGTRVLDRPRRRTSSAIFRARLCRRYSSISWKFVAVDATERRLSREL
jgi:hypothetical protein